MIWFLFWFLAIELLGLAALPLAVRLFRSLPDRGFLFAKPLGLLLVAYICWLLGAFGILRFQQATIAVVLVAVAGATWWAWGREALRSLSAVRPVIWFSEGVFLLSLAAAALVRAYNPEIAGTEKPMDFAFLNALYRGDTLPPEDPWMSGHGISYYYFGYLLMALVAKLSGVPPSVGYNLAVASVFALLLAGCQSIAYNLITALGPHWRSVRRLTGSLVAPLMVGVMGNLEIGLEVLAARGFADPSFWNWVGVKNLQVASHPEGWFPTSHWWWWRASRVIPTTKPDGINEFPYFSFMLGDLHPHYTVLPWVLLTVALSLAALMERAREKRVGPEGRLGTVVPALVLGALLVANSWDFPTYTALYWAACLVPLVPSDWSWAKLFASSRRLGLVSLVSVLLYAPFMLGFSSQTKGVGFSADKTPLASMLIIFGPFLFVLACFLVWQAWPRATAPGRVVSWALLLGGAAAVVSSWFLQGVALIVGFLLLAAAAAHRSLVEGSRGDGSAPEAPSSGVKAEGAASGGGHSALAVRSGARRFSLVMILGGLLLILGPEFVFLVDLFGTRMNTVFKFHYQAWLLLGLAASVGLVWMMASARLAARALVLVGTVLLVGVGLLYPLAATPAKANYFKSEPTIDGAAFYQKMRPDDYAAIQWLSRAVSGRPVVLEATGGQYSEYARVSTFSGLPTVMGWGGHEGQWGRRGEDLQRRTQDIEAIYKTADRSAILGLLDRYAVKYLFVGTLEMEKYGPGVADRFEGLLETAHRQGRVIIYKR